MSNTPRGLFKIVKITEDESHQEQYDGSAETVYMTITQDQYGLSIAVSKEPPTSEEMVFLNAMAAVHVDFFDNKVKLQVWDSGSDPTGDPHWVVPEDHDQYPDASIILVEDVNQWEERPKEEE